MPKLPSLQFYPGDWQKDPALKVCSHAAKGVLMDSLCLMFECEPRGVLITGGRPWSDKDWAAAVGGNGDVTLVSIRELVDKGAIKCRGSETQEFVIRHANLIEGIPTGAFYSFRMVRDENERFFNRERQSEFRKRRNNGGSNGDVTPPSHPSSSSTSSSTSVLDKQTNNGAKVPRIEEAVIHGDRIGVPKEDAEKFWHHYNSMGWIDKNGNPIRNWQSKMSVWRTESQQSTHQAKAKGETKGADTFWRDKARIDMVEGEIRAIEGRASHTAMDVIIQPKDVESYKRLKDERKALKKKLGLT